MRGEVLRADQAGFFQGHRGEQNRTFGFWFLVCKRLGDFEQASAWRQEMVPSFHIGLEAIPQSDQGLLVVCDTRLATMGYGRRLLAALPPMNKIQSAEEFSEALDRLAAATRISTTATGWT